MAVGSACAASMQQLSRVRGRLAELTGWAGLASTVRPTRSGTGGNAVALIRCLECGRDISDRAAACPGCGAPVEAGSAAPQAPDALSYADGKFIGTKRMVMDLAAASVLGAGYRLDRADEAAGTVTFTTGMTMGSWSGVTGTLYLIETEPYHFEVSGKAKQNVQGGQVLALDLFGEAGGKVQDVIVEMRRRLAAPVAPVDASEVIPHNPADTDKIIMGVSAAIVLLVLLMALGKMS